jgi:predicted dithiol-disulfide oxidoreductase (DUF899 family)
LAFRTVPWYSSHGSDFNYDFQVSLDQSFPQLQYNYRPEPELPGGERSTEMPGYSCFLRVGGERAGPAPARIASGRARG